MNKQKDLLFGIFVLGVVFAPSTQADLAIIVNPNSAVTQASADEIKRLYIGKTKLLDDGTRLVPVDHGDGREIKTEFYDKVVQKPLERLKIHWSRLTFSGRGRPPEVLGDDAKIKAWVASHDDAVGYIEADMVDESVRAVLIVE